jgi:hypothetical protein
MDDLHQGRLTFTGRPLYRVPPPKFLKRIIIFCLAKQNDILMFSYSKYFGIFGG